MRTIKRVIADEASESETVIVSQLVPVSNLPGNFEIRRGGNLAQLGLYLPRLPISHEWEVVLDDGGSQVLICHRRREEKQ